ADGRNLARARTMRRRRRRRVRQSGVLLSVLRRATARSPAGPREHRMLTCLRVRHLAIIDQLEVELGPGLNVITGETGAGTSILIDALSLVLGGRARQELVRTGAKKAEVEALFDIAGDPDALARLAASGIEADGELVVRR